MKDYTRKEFDSLTLTDTEYKMFYKEIGVHYSKHIDRIMNTENPWHQPIPHYMWRNEKRNSIIAYIEGYGPDPISVHILFVNKKKYTSRLDNLDILYVYTDLTSDELVMFDAEIANYVNDFSRVDAYIDEDGTKWPEQTIEYESDIVIEYVWNYEHNLYAKLVYEDSYREHEDYVLIKVVSKREYNLRSKQLNTTNL